MYDYNEYRPDILLTQYVENYWTSINFQNFGDIPKVFPDGCTDIIFKFDRARRTAYAGIFGTMTSFIEVYYPKSTQMFGIRFKPAGIAAFTRVPIEEFTNISVELALVNTLFSKSFYDTIADKQSMDEIVSYTNSYLINLLPCLYRLDRQIIRAVDLIFLTKGQLSLAAVASDVCLCQRHFERKFKSIIGISPKMFAKIHRFKHAKQCLRDYPRKDLLTIAIECGYYDHAHLIRDFKMLSGDAPTDFRR